MVDKPANLIPEQLMAWAMFWRSFRFAIVPGFCLIFSPNRVQGERVMIDALPDVATGLMSVVDSHTIANTLMPDLSWMQDWVQVDWSLLQSPPSTGDGYFDQDVSQGIRKAWKGFVDSGQVWAMLIGLVVGYLVKQFTTFG